MLPDILSAVLRALGFVAILQAGGAALFLALFGREIPAARLAILRLVKFSALAGAVLVLAQYLLEPARMAGQFSGVLDAELQRFALHTQLALVLALRLFGLFLLLVASRGSGMGMRSAGVFGAVLIAISFPLTGHSAESPAHALLVPLLALHLLVVEFWFGALLPLILVSGSEPMSTTAGVLARFSRLAVWLVPLILVAGVVIGALLLPDVAALRAPYGTGLMLKLLAFGLLMVLAALNKWRFVPALEHGGSMALRALRRSIGIEFALIVLVLVGTAFLTMFWSPGS